MKLVSTLLTIASACLNHQVDTQFAVPAFMPVYPPPPPVYMVPQIQAMAVIPLPKPKTTTTTSTTPKPDMGLAIAVQVPVPMPVPVYFPRPVPPPPPPPKPKCLCPACFCPGPPIPVVPAMPVYAPPPPPVMLLPVPRIIRSVEKVDTDSSESNSKATCESSDTDISSSKSRRRGRKRIKKKIIKKKNYRRKYSFRRSFDDSRRGSKDSDIVKPVLTYISKNGHVKFKQRLNNDDAAKLLGDKPMRREKAVQSVRAIINNDPKFSGIEIQSDLKTPSNVNKHKSAVLRNSAPIHLGEGKKELLFKPSENKRISNLSISFQVV